MDEAAANRRRLARPDESLTTAEIYAQKHGIPADVSAALQNGVGMRIRQAASMGRQSAFGRTQSMPAVQFGQPGSAFTSSFGSGSGGGGGFLTHSQTVAQAQGIISREELRRRELRPFSSDDADAAFALRSSGVRAGTGTGTGVAGLGLVPAGSGFSSGSGSDSGSGLDGDTPAGQRRLTFSADGTVSMEGDTDGVRGSFDAPNFGLAPLAMAQGRKRGRGKDEDTGAGTGVGAQEGYEDGNGDDGGESDEEKTEVDEDEPAPMTTAAAAGMGLDGSTLIDVDAFPPVFASPAISHPELFDSFSPSHPPARSPAMSTSQGDFGFGSQAGGRGLMLPPPVPGATGAGFGGSGRTHRSFGAGAGAGTGGRAGRMLHKTVSAPVHMHMHGNAYGNAYGGGMDLDGDGDDSGMPDGFDVAEWAKAEPQ